MEFEAGIYTVDCRRTIPEHLGGGHKAAHPEKIINFVGFVYIYGEYPFFKKAFYTMRNSAIPSGPPEIYLLEWNEDTDKIISWGEKIIWPKRETEND